MEKKTGKGVVNRDVDLREFMTIDFDMNLQEALKHVSDTNRVVCREYMGSYYVVPHVNKRLLEKILPSTPFTYSDVTASWGLSKLGLRYISGLVDNCKCCNGCNITLQMGLREGCGPSPFHPSIATREIEYRISCNDCGETTNWFSYAGLEKLLAFAWNNGYTSKVAKF